MENSRIPPHQELDNGYKQNRIYYLTEIASLLTAIRTIENCIPIYKGINSNREIELLKAYLHSIRESALEAADQLILKHESSILSYYERKNLAQEKAEKKEEKKSSTFIFDPTK